MSCLLEHHHHIHALHCHTRKLPSATILWPPGNSTTPHVHQDQDLAQGHDSGVSKHRASAAFSLYYPGKCKNETLGQVLFFSYHWVLLKPFYTSTPCDIFVNEIFKCLKCHLLCAYPQGRLLPADRMCNDAYLSRWKAAISALCLSKSEK